MEIDKLIEGADVVRLSKAQGIKRLGHIQRMDRARPTGKLLDWKPMGTRPVGRPRQRWQEGVMEDLKNLKVKNWKYTAKDRRTWKDLTEVTMMMVNLLNCILYEPFICGNPKNFGVLNRPKSVVLKCTCL